MCWEHILASFAGQKREIISEGKLCLQQLGWWLFILLFTTKK
jgi:hypothetical protein